VSLPAGTRLGPYEVLAPLGAGGMGEVYRARDTKLSRDVALKLLPEAVASDRDRLARLRREAQVLASLNHPHIAAIYGLEESDGALALVLELLEGETLEDHLRRGRIPFDGALAIARQIAEGLEAAHERGVIHRDLKPANVKVTGDGNVKLLDFGLAKAMEGETADADAGVSNSPTLSRRMTEAGLILGTAAYMSPEQARGKPVDKRTDIWAFGVVLYEMLAGQRLFQGETVSDTLAAVLTHDPDWTALPDRTPSAISRLLHRCLARDPRERLHDIGDARLEISDALAGAGRAEPLVSPAQGRRAMLWVRWPASLLIVAGVAALAAFRAAGTGPPQRAAAVRRFDLAIEDLDTDTGRAPVISPDGRRIVYIAAQALWVRDLDRLEPRVLVKTGAPWYPFWSPDSEMVAYLSSAKLWKVPADGGEPTVVTNAAFSRGALTPGGAWLEDGRIVFAQAANGTGLLSVSAEGGDFTLLHDRAPKLEDDFHAPSALPRGRGVIFVVDRRPQGPDTIALLAGGTRREILRLEGELLDAPVYSPSGHIVYWRRSGNQGVWALPFSLERLERTGDPFLIAPDAAWPSVSADGTLLVSPFGQGRFQLAWVDRQGAVASPVGEPLGLRGYGSPVLSPDGRRIAFLRGDRGREGLNPYSQAVSGGPPTRLSFGGERSGFSNVTFDPTGNRVLFDHSRSRGLSAETAGQGGFISDCAADGSGGERTLVTGASQPELTRDGKFLVFSRVADGTGRDLWTLALGKDGLPAPDAKPEPLIVAPHWQHRARVSPDGRLVAYAARDGTETENVFLSRFPKGDGRWQVSTGEGRRPQWNRSGSRLYWENDEGLWEADVRTSPTFSLSDPRLVFRGAAARIRLFGGFAVAPDEKRFLVLRAVRDAGSRAPALTVVENWFADFSGKQPGPGESQ